MPVCLKGSEELQRTFLKAALAGEGKENRNWELKMHSGIEATDRYGRLADSRALQLRNTSYIKGKALNSDQSYYFVC